MKQDNGLECSRMAMQDLILFSQNAECPVTVFNTGSRNEGLFEKQAEKLSFLNSRRRNAEYADFLQYVTPDCDDR